MKGNEENDKAKLIGYSCSRKFSDAELDVIEMALYGGVNREGLQCRVKSNMEIFKAFTSFSKAKPPLPDCPHQ